MGDFGATRTGAIAGAGGELALESARQAAEAGHSKGRSLSKILFSSDHTKIARNRPTTDKVISSSKAKRRKDSGEVRTKRW